MKRYPNFLYVIIQKNLSKYFLEVMWSDYNAWQQTSMNVLKLRFLFYLKILLKNFLTNKK